MAHARPQPRLSPFAPPDSPSQDSAIREFSFESELPTSPTNSVEELIEKAIAESGQYPFGWSVAPPQDETPTLLRPPAEEDLELCAERRVPTFSLDHLHLTAPRPQELALPLRDPGPPTTPSGPFAFSQRPTRAPDRQAPRGNHGPAEAVSLPPPDIFRVVAQAPLRPRTKPVFAEPPRALPETEYLGPRAKPASSTPPGSSNGKGTSSHAPLQTGGIRVLMSEEQIRALPLDHRAGFLLSMVGLVHTVDELLDISGMSRGDAMRLLIELVDLGAIDLG